MALIELKNVTYQVGDEQVLKEVNLKLEEGDWFTLTGPSGCGKSTILRLIADLISATSGELTYQGQAIESYQPEEYRRQVSYCFQQANLFGETVRDNLEFPYLVRGQKIDQKRAEAVLKTVALDASYLDKKIVDLSGGEKQRVGLVRNLLFTPQVLLLDEVTTGLDEENKRIVRATIEDAYQQGVTIMEITHDQVELANAKHLVKMEEKGLLNA
ncbi:ATP-binding cassette domain-containing protein [Limosilactobacillus fermentum]|uniref:ABC transporter ATP-binding protein n=1 Tax=Limosilactobacillus fermentum TaxID=1613 RepID=UPI000C2493C4|nr:ATP-binding cassette domain-containing protein [Limosilactobacillus fermentum]MBM9560620.1 ATP-binding cassette domain-containing protein [Limosilactobacillus fermentum]